MLCVHIIWWVVDQQSLSSANNLNDLMRFDSFEAALRGCINYVELSLDLCKINRKVKQKFIKRIQVGDEIGNTINGRGGDNKIWLLWQRMY